MKPKEEIGPIIISPVALFEDDSSGYERAQYIFVQCPAGDDDVIDEAGEWIKLYAKKHSGRVITNFDEQRPLLALADAPLSYQNLIAKTYDRAVIKQFVGTMHAERIDTLIITGLQ